MNILLSKVLTTNSIELLKKCLLLFLFLYCTRLYTEFGFLSFIISFLLISTLIIKFKHFNNPVFWTGIIVLLLLESISHFYVSANHHFVLIYICTYILIATIYPSNSINIISINSRLILFFVFFFAGLQKIL